MRGSESPDACDCHNNKGVILPPSEMQILLRRDQQVV